LGGEGCDMGSGRTFVERSSLQSLDARQGKETRVHQTRDEEDVKLEVLQLTPSGIFLWVNGDLPDPVRESFFAIGSGAPYAMGALTMGASLAQAIEVAAKWDNGTRLPVDTIALAKKAVPKKSRGTGWKKALGDQ
jgi:hypothetical protein